MIAIRLINIFNNVFFIFTTPDIVCIEMHAHIQQIFLYYRASVSPQLWLSLLTALFPVPFSVFVFTLTVPSCFDHTK